MLVISAAASAAAAAAVHVRSCPAGGLGPLLFARRAVCGPQVENANFHDMNSFSPKSKPWLCVVVLAGMRLTLARLSPLLGASIDYGVMVLQPGSIRRSTRLAGVKVR